jgi:hypothetical protein
MPKKQQRRFTEKDMANSARADREAGNRFGLLMRERSLEMFRRACEGYYDVDYDADDLIWLAEVSKMVQ